jgi:hypothetical protein
MSEPGYVDYARTSLATGFLLNGFATPITVLQFVGQFYVGSWPFINTFWSCVGGTDNYTVELYYFTDNTYTTTVGVQIGVRNGNSVAWKQYAVLTPWLRIYIRPAAGGSGATVHASFYGTTQEASSGKLGSTDVAFFEQFVSIPASSFQNFVMTRILPGMISISWFTNAASYNFQILRWDITAAAYLTFWEIDAIATLASGTALIAVPDAPLQVHLENGDAAAKVFKFRMVPVS